MLKNFIIFTLLLLVPQALNAYDVDSYTEDNDNKSIVQRSIEKLGGREKADAYFHTYYQLIDAIGAGKRKEAEALIDKIGADALVPYDGAFESPLMAAIKQKRYLIAKYLLEHEADPNRRMYEGYLRTTALMHAAREDDPMMVDLLLEYGADANLESGEGYTALDLALGMLGHANEEIVNMLIPATDLSKPIKYYELTSKKAPATPLTIAFKFGRKYSIIDALIDAGATAGKSDASKHEFIKAFLKYSARYTNQEKLYKYSKVAFELTKGSHSAIVEHDLIYLYAQLYESAIVTGHTLDKEELQGFKKLANREPKAKAFLKMFTIIEASMHAKQSKALEEWQKKYASLVKNEWCFSALREWSQSLDKKEKGYVTETVERLKRMVHS